MKFAYRAYSRDGSAVSGTLEVASGQSAEATEQLRRRGLFVTELRQEHSGGSGANRRTSGGTRRLRRLVSFARQMSVLVSTGTTIVEAMQSVERQTTDEGWREALSMVRKRVEEGEQLSRAMEARPDVFDPVCRSLIAAGESGGQLDTMLERLSKLARQQLKMRSQLSGALVYPIVLIAVALAVVVTMVAFVMPRFEGLFRSLNTPLPMATAYLMSIGAFAREWWWAVLPVLGLGAASVWLWARTPNGNARLDSLVLELPHIGGVKRSFITARMARVLGVLLEGRVPLLEALDLTRQSAGSMRFARVIDDARDAVTRGESVSAAFSASGLVVPSVCEAMRSGERSGQVAPVLLTIADSLDEENEITLKTITTLLEPAILIIMGLIVGGVAVSMFLPLFDLTAGAGGGS